MIEFALFDTTVRKWQKIIDTLNTCKDVNGISQISSRELAQSVGVCVSNINHTIKVMNEEQEVICKRHESYVVYVQSTDDIKQLVLIEVLLKCLAVCLETNEIDKAKALIYTSDKELAKRFNTTQKIIQRYKAFARDALKRSLESEGV